jgi:hypothetical protein
MSVNPDTNKPEIVEIPQKNKRDGLSRDGLFKRDNYFLERKTDFRSGPQSRSGFNLALWSWMSALIDTLVLISISCFCLVLFSFLIKTPMGDVFKILSLEPNIKEMFAISFVFSFWVYLVIMRVFMGASLGEWSCQLRLGQPLQRIKPTYVLRVAARTTTLLLTGVVTIPLISLLLKRDLLGELTGIYIYSLK